MRRRFLLVLVVCLVLPGSALASWLGSGAGNGHVKATNLSSGNAPAGSVSGRNLTVGWTAPSGGAPISGYTVKRYTTGGTAQTINSNCSGTVSGLSCTELNLPSGSWTYTVTPRQGNWQGAESPVSSVVSVGSPALAISGSTTLASLPTTLGGTISNFLSGQTATFRLDDPSTGPVLTGSITPTTTPANGQATVSVTIPSGTANGSHTIYAIGSAGDVASAAITVAVPTTITTTASNLRDASSGTETNQSDLAAFVDGRLFASGNFSTAFSATRYVQFDMNSALPAGRTVSGANLNFRFADSTAGDTTCFYFEVRRVSTGSVLATHGSSASPVGCNATTAQQTFTTSLPEVSTSDIANDLRIRVFAKESGSKSIRVDTATVSGSTPQVEFTLYDPIVVNAATGTATTTPWGIATVGDGAAYASASNWTTAFVSTRYLKLTFPSYVPATAAVNSVSLKHTYRPSTTGNTCYYFAVYSGATLIGTHGSSAAPVSCNSTTTYTTDTVALPEVTTAAMANGLTVRYYVRNASSLKSQDDLDTVTINYTD